MISDYNPYPVYIISTSLTILLSLQLSHSVTLLGCMGHIVLLLNWNYILSEPVPMDIISSNKYFGIMFCTCADVL